ncbi:hypothetical protein SDRG_02086 [Saprolegnia diclina VS20]|uniref:CRC domain-containing protein n=1 Tax=Saprolegnia diclina (strain VS20) TaxID=1156394 RepID=T0QSC4_SAPDV|nr:hypothetical protein SDRG_02086 [Saprolegnia diclina VS20]EQC41029.1 hypothetical protein SDRG_02086 [Saprolegnia diclina VS20]|eukprot:XP_008605873.1 hypothetical protein SDRG_02086 [Saprolegnia diclina VS20]
MSARSAVRVEVDGPEVKAKPAKRSPLSALSVSDVSNQAKRPRLEDAPVSPAVSEPAIDDDDDERPDEVNAAWLDMCYALLARKRGMKGLPAAKLPVLAISTVAIERPAMALSAADIGPESREADIEVLAEQLHKESHASTTCCGCKTGCLKLYCRCFLTKGFCTPQCGCTSCMNTRTSTDRLSAITAHLKNNIHAFRSSTAPATMSHGKLGPAPSASIRHQFIPLVPNVGANAITCRCKKSKCSKKYCDCYQAGVPCGPKCQCRDCCNHTPQETNVKQVLYAHDTIKVLVTRKPRQNTITKSVRVQL